MKTLYFTIALTLFTLSCARSHPNVEVTTAITPVKPLLTKPDLNNKTALMPNGDKAITLAQIMADPDWIGRQPESWYWGDNSNTIFYKQKREGNHLRDLFSKSLNEQGNGKKVSLAKLHLYSDKNAVTNLNKTHEVYTFEGNVFVKTLNTGAVNQVTYTSAIETDAMFLNNGDIAYRIDNVFYSINLNNSQVKELANLLTTRNDDNADVSYSNHYLAQQQAKLINFVKLHAKNEQLKNNHQRNLRVSNPSITQTNFIFSRTLKVVHASLSPAGNKMIVSLTPAKPSANAPSNASNIMPEYITNNGDISIKSVRSKVADNEQYHEYVYLLDITDGTMEYLSFEDLPGFDDDVLADVRAENYSVNGNQYKSKKSPRYIHIMNAKDPIQWNAQGDKVAILFEAWDNKDRWLATVNFERKALVSQHRLHDNAWINWSFNEFGWINAQSHQKHLNDRLYYLSEESGYSHLYVKPLNAKAQQITQGNFEVNDLTLGEDEQKIFYRANQNHPGIYEIYAVNIDSKKSTQLTDLGGNNHYRLSPDNAKLLVMHSTINTPPELYVENIDLTPKALRLTHTVSEAFVTMPWSVPNIVAITSSNQQLPIYSKVYLPEGFNVAPSKNKAVMFTHGAGYLQNAHFGWSDYFREHLFHHLLVQNGYVVIDMDYRASAGYGREWRTSIYRHMGKPELEDMRDGVNWLVENANVDRTRIGTYGGSYGGFLTLMALFKEPDLFQSGAALRLVSDWAYYNHGYTSNILNTPYDDPIAYERSSPIYFAQGLQKPLLINAPMVDDNVFFQDTVRLVQRLIELEKQNFETAIYPVEPHGFIQPSSWLNEYRKIFKLFETTL